MEANTIRHLSYVADAPESTKVSFDAPDSGRLELVGVHLGARVERRLGNGVGANFRDTAVGNNCERQASVEGSSAENTSSLPHPLSNQRNTERAQAGSLGRVESLSLSQNKEYKVSAKKLANKMRHGRYTRASKCTPLPSFSSIARLNLAGLS